MNSYSLSINKYRQLFDKFSLNRLLVLGCSILLIIVTISLVYFGRTNYFFAFCIMLSIYGVILGYLMARSEYESRLPNTQIYNFLHLLSANDNYLEVIVTKSNIVLYQNKPTEKGLDFTNKTILELINELNLHELDKVALISYFESDQNSPFATIYAQKLENSTEKWMSCSIKPTYTNKRERVFVFQIEDITEAQQATLSQQQYIKDMENIIELNYNPNSSLHLISKMASSRDVMQPVKTIQSYIRLIEKEYKNQLGQQGQEAIRHISSSSYQLETMMEDLFSLTGIDDRKSKEPTIFLKEVVEEVINRLQHEIATTQAKINVKSLPKIQADRNQLNILFQNLIENAINYCGEQRPIITIDAKKEDRYWIISVTDQGMGIAASEKAHIFNYLNRGQIKTGIKGLGLGLPICKQIVKNHNGDIWVESDGIGKGSSFVFTFPIQPTQQVKSLKEMTAIPHAVSA